MSDEILSMLDAEKYPETCSYLASQIDDDGICDGLYDMAANGDVMYKKSLDSAIVGQSKARDTLAKKQPSENWDLDG